MQFEEAGEASVGTNHYIILLQTESGHICLKFHSTSYKNDSIKMRLVVLTGIACSFWLVPLSLPVFNNPRKPFQPNNTRSIYC